MPDIDGIELLGELSPLAERLPVVMMTGHGGESLRQKATELGAVAFLERPFRPVALRETIRTVLKLDADD